MCFVLLQRAGANRRACSIKLCAFIVASYFQKFASELLILGQYADEQALTSRMFGQGGEYFFLQARIPRNFSECLTAQFRLARDCQSNPADLRWIFE